MNNIETILKLENVKKRFKEKEVLSGINLNVRKGESIGLVGSNGAGKTTILSIVQGIKKPTSGFVEVFGGLPEKPKNRVKLGVSPQSISLPDTSKVGELVNFVRKHFSNSADYDELISEFHLEDMVNKKVGGLSGGQKRLLSACLAFSGNPELVLLDEPTSGLDVQTRDSLWRIIKSKNRGGTTIVVTSHYFEDIETLTDRIVKIDRGTIHLDSTLTSIKNEVQLKKVSLKTSKVSAFNSLPGVISFEMIEENLILKTNNSEKLIKEIIMTGEHFEDLNVYTDSLDRYFMSATDISSSKKELK